MNTAKILEETLKQVTSIRNQVDWFSRPEYFTNLTKDRLAQIGEDVNKVMTNIMILNMFNGQPSYTIQNAGWNCNICKAPVAEVWDDVSKSNYECKCGEWTLEMARRGC